MLQAEHQLIAQNANIGAARGASWRIPLDGDAGDDLDRAQRALRWRQLHLQRRALDRPAAVRHGRGATRATSTTPARRRRWPRRRPTKRAIGLRSAKVADARWRSGARSKNRYRRSARARMRRASRRRLSDARYRAVDFSASADAQRTAYAAQQQLVTTRLTQAEQPCRAAPAASAAGSTRRLCSRSRMRYVLPEIRNNVDVLGERWHRPA
ncbi:hypothetical protein AB5I41_13505 [Sphingomonas sp. MMS24-JH45]